MVNFTAMTLRQCLTRLFVAGLCCFSLGALAQSKDEMSKLQKDIEALQAELKAVQGERSSLQKQVEKSETQINDLQKKADKIKQEMQQQNQQLQQMNNKRSSLERQQQAQKAQLAEQVRASYKLGQTSEIKVLLNQESPDALGRMMKYHSYFMAAQNQKLDSYRATIAEIDQLTPQIQQKTAELAQLQSQFDGQREQLKKIHGQRQAALAQANANLKDKQQELKQLQRDRDRLQALMNQVTRRVAGAAKSPSYVPLPAAGAKFTSRKGRLPWPTQGTMTHRFGSPRIAGQINWSGAYINAAQGTPVVAVHYGRVVFADYFGSHGLLVIVDHGEGYMSLYAHNQVLLKKAGELVKAGETIARVGSTGGQPDNGLYFEIRYQGKPINPDLWLARN